MRVSRIILIALMAAISTLAKAEEAPSPPSYVFSPPVGWVRDADYKRAQEAWFDPKSKATLTIQATFGKENFVIAPSGVGDAVKLLTKIRRLATEFIGVEDWKIAEHKLEKKASGQILMLVGSYKGAGGHAVRFYEWQYFFGKRYYQITYADEETDSRTQAEILKILSGFAPEGWIAEAKVDRTWFRGLNLFPEDALADGQGKLCTNCGVKDPTELPPRVNLLKHIKPEPEILTAREIADVEARRFVKLGCKPDQPGGEITPKTLALCVGEIIKGFTEAVWDDLTSFSLFGGTDFVKNWWKTGSAGEAFQEWKHNQLNVIKKLTDTFKKLWPTMKLFAAKEVAEWKCMTPEERTLMLCKTGAYVVTHGVLITTSGGALGVAYSAMKAGKLGAVGLKIVAGLKKAKKVVLVATTVKRIEKVEEFDKGYEILTKVAITEQAALRVIAGGVKLSNEKWVRGVHVSKDGKVFIRRGDDIFMLRDEQLRKLAVKRWNELQP